MTPDDLRYELAEAILRVVYLIGSIGIIAGLILLVASSPKGPRR